MAVTFTSTPYNGVTPSIKTAHCTSVLSFVSKFGRSRITGTVLCTEYSVQSSACIAVPL